MESTNTPRPVFESCRPVAESMILPPTVSEGEAALLEMSKYFRTEPLKDLRKKENTDELVNVTV